MKRDIHERIYQLVILVIVWSKGISKSSVNFVLVQQLIRAITSVGANDQEADGTNSKKDFIAKYSIVRKEAKEARYWVNIIIDTIPELKSDKNTQYILKELDEIIKIVSTIMYKTSSKL